MLLKKVVAFLSTKFTHEIAQWVRGVRQWYFGMLGSYARPFRPEKNLGWGAPQRHTRPHPKFGRKCDFRQIWPKFLYVPYGCTPPQNFRPAQSNDPNLFPRKISLGNSQNSLRYTLSKFDNFWAIFCGCQKVTIFNSFKKPLKNGDFSKKN